MNDGDDDCTGITFSGGFLGIKLQCLCSLYPTGLERVKAI